MELNTENVPLSQNDGHAKGAFSIDIMNLVSEDHDVKPPPEYANYPHFWFISHQAYIESFTTIHDTLTNSNTTLPIETQRLLALRLAFNQAKNQIDTEATAETDPLTGAANRKSLGKFIELIQQKLTSPDSKLKNALAYYLDVDLFKQINDKLGHSIGDQVLRTIVTTAQDKIRLDSLVARVGGDEFMIVVPEYDFELDISNDVQKRHQLNQAEEVRKAINSSVRSIIDTDAYGTVSLGITTITPSDTFESLYERVSTLLEQAKNNGKNTIQHDLFDPSQEIAIS